MNFETTPAASQTPAFTDIRPQWKALAANRAITKEDIVALALYCSVIRAGELVETVTRLHRAFKPISNAVKLQNGAYPYFALIEAINMIKYSTVMTWLNEAEKKLLLSLAEFVQKEATK